MFFIVILACGFAFAGQQPAKPGENSKVIMRIGFNYVPTAQMEFTNNNDNYEIYDNLFWHVAVEYRLSELVSVGPSIEHLGRNVNPYGYFDDNITATVYGVDCRFSHCLIDSGASYLVFGVGTGISTLKEAGDGSGTGFCVYALVGLDIALAGPVGLDLLYRYQGNIISVSERRYRFNGSAVMAGLNYRIRF